MNEKDAADDAVARHLLEAIERVRDDVEKVEFWAGAVAGFARPVPQYTPDEASVWLPTEQASTLRSKLREPDSREAESDSREAKPLREPKSGRSKSSNNRKSSRNKPPAGPRG